MTEQRRRSRPKAQKSETRLVLREHVFVVNDSSSYYGLLRRVRHAHYDLEALLQFCEGGVLGSQPSMPSIGDLLLQAQRLCEEWRKLEPPITWNRNEDGTINRQPVEIEDRDLAEHLRKRIVHWQETERCLSQLYTTLATGVLETVKTVDPKSDDGLLPEFIELYMLGFGDRGDPGFPRVSYQIAFDPKGTTELSLEDHSGRRTRAEKRYKQSLRALAAATVARGERTRAQVLTRLTVVLVVLTLVLVAQTAVLMWPKQPSGTMNAPTLVSTSTPEPTGTALR